MTIQYLLLIAISLSGIPVGLLISKYTKEELKEGRKWFKLIMALCAVIFAFSLIIDEINLKSSIMAVSGFVFLLSLTSLKKS